MKPNPPNNAAPHNPRQDWDSPWKEALVDFFQEFVCLCFPLMAQEIDWARGYAFLDKELQAISKKTATGTRTVDKLVKVYRKKTEVWVLVHAEVQGQAQSDFAERMFTYYYRLYDRYRVPIISVALLIDVNPVWLPNRYQFALWGTNLQFEYNVVKILAYQAQSAALKESTNPFATVILTQLAAINLAKANSSQQQLMTKLTLAKSLYEKGWAKDYIYKLFRFIDWLIDLPEDLMIEFDQQLHHFEEVKHMPYITSLERLYMKRGMEKGMEEGLEKGMQKGMQKGKGEGRAEIVQNLYQVIKDEKEVARLTKLTVKKVQELLKIDTAHNSDREESQ